ncbi:hypothetical protein LSAT2_004997 [Lamellibrachia satsuma]|nr:hypothetical protein LSAT2_004997 [Lamellibrachia satsuma]
MVTIDPATAFNNLLPVNKPQSPQQLLQSTSPRHHNNYSRQQGPVTTTVPVNKAQSPQQLLQSTSPRYLNNNYKVEATARQPQHLAIGKQWQPIRTFCNLVNQSRM